jgi:UDPglucose--hexose-1-phosphate uridylyltransferase
MRELRKDPVLNRWVIISTERSLRPSDFQHAEKAAEDGGIDPFAEGNEHLTTQEIYALRSPNSAPNGPGWQLRVIPNKYPALGVEGDLDPRGYGLYDRMNGVGAHEVVVETPQSEVGLRDLPLGQIVDILSTIRLRVEDLSRDMRFAYILPFKNHGQAAGASLRHSHSQIIATPVIPGRVMEELKVADEHWTEKRRSIFVDILDQELMMGERVVWESEEFLAFCPYASSSPFEVHLYPRQQGADYRRASTEQLRALALVLKTVLLKWQDALGDVAYNLLIRTAPYDTLLSSVRGEYPCLTHTTSGTSKCSRACRAQPDSSGARASTSTPRRLKKQRPTWPESRSTQRGSAELPLAFAPAGLSPSCHRAAGAALGAPPCG